MRQGLQAWLGRLWPQGAAGSGVCIRRAARLRWRWPSQGWQVASSLKTLLASEARVTTEKEARAPGPPLWLYDLEQIC